MTTLEAFCEKVGWQGGTIHQAQEHFDKSDQNERDQICGFLIDRLSEISDPRGVAWFTTRRLELLGIEIEGVS